MACPDGVRQGVGRLQVDDQPVRVVFGIGEPEHRDGDAFHAPFLAHLHGGAAPWSEQLDPAFDHAGKRIAFLVAAWIKRKSGPLGENGVRGVDGLSQRCTHQASDDTSFDRGATMGDGTNWCAIAEQTLHHIDTRSRSPQVNRLTEMWSIP